MNENMELMAHRERQRIKQGMLRMAEKRSVMLAGEVKSRILFYDYGPSMEMLLNEYGPAGRRNIIYELTLEIIDELIDGLTKTKDRILRGGEI